MTIQEFYTYSWFSNLAYVDWSPNAIAPDGFSPSAANQAIIDANAPDVERVPGSTSDSPINTLGEKIFIQEGWRVASFEENDPDTGFSASLFVNETTGEKVLGIRGTEPQGDQLLADLIRADLAEIGFLGMALSQAVSLFNYVQRLKSTGNDVLRLELKLSTPVSGEEPPAGVNSVTVIPGVKIWFKAHRDATGLGLIDETDNLTITGHSLGGHLAAIGQRLFPALFDQTVTFNAPGFDPATAGFVTPFVHCPQDRCIKYAA